MSEREQYVFPVRSVFNNGNPVLADITGDIPDVQPGDREERDGDISSHSRHTSSSIQLETSDSDTPKVDKSTKSPTTHHANFDRRKGGSEKVSSSVGHDRPAPRGIDRNVHLNDPNQPLPEDEEIDTQPSSSDPSSADYGPTKQEEEEREHDYVQSKMELSEESASTDSESSKLSTRKQPSTAAEAMDLHKDKMNRIKDHNKSDLSLESVPFNSPEDESSISSLADEDEQLPTTRRFKYFEEDGNYFLRTHHQSKMKKCEDEPIGRPGAIQPFGAMIVLQNDDNGNSLVRQASENCSEIIGCSPEFLFSLTCFTTILDNDSRLKMRDVLFDLAVAEDSESDGSSDEGEKEKAQVFGITGRGDDNVDAQYSESELSAESQHNNCHSAVHKPDLPRPLNSHYPPPEEVFGKQGLFIIELEPVVSLKYPAYVDEVSKLPKEFDNRDARPAESLDLNLSNSDNTPKSGATHGSGSTTAALTSNSGADSKTGTNLSGDTVHAVPSAGGGTFHLETGQQQKQTQKETKQRIMTHEAEFSAHGNDSVSIEDISRSTTAHNKPLKTLSRIRKADRAHETRQRVATLLEDNNKSDEDDEAANKRRKAHRRSQARAKIQRNMSMPGSLSSLDVVSLLGEINEQLSSADNIQELFDVTVGIVKSLTQFHRIMLYQFDPEYNGKVVAELVEWQRMKDLYYGLHFPASDIPPQARELYKTNKVRQLYDRDQLTARMVVRHKIDLAYPLNMSHCALRAMSPVHIKYLENMDVRASLSISIVAFGQLYGLVACHSGGENGMRVTFPMLQVLKLLSDSISRNVERLAYTRRLQSRKLISTVPSDTNPGGYIASTAFDLLSIFDADYGLLSIGDTMKIMGESDRSREIVAIGEFLRMKGFDQLVYTNNISKNFPELKQSDRKDALAGLLCIPLSNTGSDYICFLRKGQLSSVSWAGNPNKNDDEALRPRASFKKWTENVILSAKQWEDEQLETAGVLAVVYGKFIEIWRQRTEVSRSNQLSRILLSNASHEVRTPLNHIINYVELALEGTLDPETRENLVRSRDASKSLLFTINDLLDLTKVESGQEVLFNEPVNLKHLVVETVQEFHQEAEKRGLTIKVDIEKSSIHVISDHRKLRTIFTSLVSNAIKYNKENGSVGVTVTEMEQESDSRANIALVVQDDGIGIKKKKLEALFTEFERVEQQGTEGGSSDNSDVHLGLGLASCARAIEQLDGQLKCSSEPNKGTTFTVIIPFNLPDKQTMDVSMLIQIDKATKHQYQSASNTESSDMSERSFRIRYKNRMQKKENAGSESTNQSNISEEFDHIGQQVKRMERNELDSFVEALAPSSRTNKTNSKNSKNSYGSGKSAGPNVDVNKQQSTTSGSNYASSKDSAGSSKKKYRKGRFQVQDSAYPIRAGPGQASSIPQSDIHSVSEDIDGLRINDTESVDSRNQSTAKTHSEYIADEKPPRIIYIDDDPINRNILKKKLTKNDRSIVELANNGDAGAQVVIEDEEGFDIVLMDLLMPIKDGYESCKAIRNAEKEGKIKSRIWHELNGRLPIFAVSASISPSHHGVLIESGFDAFFTKPINFDLLSNRLIASLVDKEKYSQSVYNEESRESFERGGFLRNIQTFNDNDI
ncbi:hypothetical protein E3Q24_03638 [Wallemia mellicola]|nr:hypothetical protein E3Q24_03638 [Wallemia mellicola]